MQRRSIAEQRKITAQVVERNRFRLSSKFADSRDGVCLAGALKTGRCPNLTKLAFTANPEPSVPDREYAGNL